MRNVAANGRLLAPLLFLAGLSLSPAGLPVAVAEPQRGDFTIVSLGDLLYANPQASTDDPELKKVIDLIRSGDVAIANQEGEAFDRQRFTGHPYGAGQVLGQPTLARDYRELGIDMVTMANNHSTDWGRQGLADSAALLDAASVAHAGSGLTLAEARRAATLQTAGGGVALLAAASTFKANAAALDAFAGTPGRAGISTLRLRVVRLVTEEDMKRLRGLATTLASPLEPAPEPNARQLVFGEKMYRVAPTRGLQYDMNLFDHDGIVGAVKKARTTASYVVFGIHAHESPTGVDDDTPAPPDFLVRLFHDVIDAGADVAMGGGPHSLRGIEIYRGRPVFYGLGLFFFKPSVTGSQETATEDYPATPYPEAPDPRPSSPPSWYESILPISVFHDGRLREIRLYPIDLRHDQAGHRGLPHLADPATARRILDRLRRDSRQFGTRIDDVNGIGIVRP